MKTAFLPYDRAVSFYDKTRGYAGSTGQRICESIIAYTQANHESHFLEIGVGTGRIATPFIERGYNYFGIDLSHSMIKELKRKIGKLKIRDNNLAVANALELPFRETSFNIVIIVHVLHVIKEWEKALNEAVRVLDKRSGYLIIAYDKPAQEDMHFSGITSPNELVRRKWRDILKELGVNYSKIGIWGNDVRVKDYLLSLGASVTDIELESYEYPPASPYDIFKRTKEKNYSGDWAIPDKIFEKAINKLEDWLAYDCQNYKTPLPITGSFRAIIGYWR